ncbi:inhibitor of growth protein 4 isoform X1 [Culicoides brevitarsis]|uniref:inhibitor of growth protein 4 isoform X1 n=1 Tax=Culicoides brevitarsis TaxID=469753 RepID=UPI00307B6564
MTSALYLEHYLDGLDNLPNDLKRNFTLMRDLDKRAQTLMKEVDERAGELLHSMTGAKESISEEARKDSIKKIQELFNKAKTYGDEKVQIAIQTYELVDKHIRRLDSDLARFEGEIQDKTLQQRPGSKAEESAAKTTNKKRGRKAKEATKASGKKSKKAGSSDDEGGRGAATAGPGKKGRSKVNQEKEGRKGQKKGDAEEVLSTGSHTPHHPSDVLDMPVDPNEPTYCLCHQVSYGEMIGCDNPDCPIEWFHFACVGLTTKPKGKWYCPKCSNERKKK